MFEKLKLNNQKGFSLLELMVVVTIVGILSLFATPQVKKTLENIRMKSTARILNSAVRLARRTAVMKRTNANLYIDLDKEYIKIEYFDNDTSDTKIVEGSQYYMPTLVNITSVAISSNITSGVANLVFTSSGTTQNTYNYIHFAYYPLTSAQESAANKNKFYTILINQSTGRPRIINFGVGGSF